MCELMKDENVSPNIGEEKFNSHFQFEKEPRKTSAIVGCWCRPLYCDGIFISDADARPFGRGDPFGFTLGSDSEKQMTGEVNKYGLTIFSFPICITVLEGMIDDLKMTITLPPEVEKADGELAWQGDLDEGQEHCLHPVLRSKIPINKWSRDITGHFEFWYGGERYRKDVSWGRNGYKEGKLQLIQGLDVPQPAR